MDRIGWKDYFMKMAFLVSERSSCLRRKVGAVLVMDHQLLTTGYNGAPRNIRHCAETGCLREKLNVPSGERHELCTGVHAEQNAILQAARHGININGAELFCTNFPCSICVKMLINVGVKNIYFAYDYEDIMSRTLLLEAGVSYHQHEMR